MEKLIKYIRLYKYSQLIKFELNVNFFNMQVNYYFFFSMHHTCSPILSSLSMVNFSNIKLHCV